MKNKIILVLIVFLFILVFDINYSSNKINDGKNENTVIIEGVKNSRIEHPIIDIHGDTEFSNFPNKTGYGNSTHPYIIENLEIYSTDSNCIQIKYTTVHFIIKDCLLYSGSRRAVILQSAINGKLLNNTIVEGGIGISSSDYINITANTINGGMLMRTSSHHNIIQNNNITNDGMGIDILGHDMTCTNITISNNNINTTEPYWPDAFGVRIYEGVTDVKMSNNILIGQGIWIEEETQARVTSHTIDNSNKINGKNIYYYKNVNGLTSANFINAGQIILANCDLCTISNLDLSGCGIGIALYYSNNNDIINCNSSQIDASGWTGLHYFGIYLLDSDLNVISGLIIDNPDVGIYCDKLCNFNTFENCIITHCEYGILLASNCNDNTIRFNEVRYGERHGIFLNQDNTGNYVLNNIVENNGWDGIVLSGGSSDNEILNNTVKNNPDGIKFSPGANNNKIYFNEFWDNTEQALDGGSNNVWDNGAIGNYWSDYLGVDVNDDGIGDTPYSILGTAGSIDNYPIWWDPLVFRVILPKNNEGFNACPNYNIIIDEGVAHTMWYTLDAGITNTMTTNLTGKIKTSIWNSVEDGILTIYFSVNDSRGFTSSEDVTIYKDTKLPIISIISPDNNEVFGTIAPSFELIINELNEYVTWYSLDEGKTNTTFSGLDGTINQNTWDNVHQGEIIITFYISDIAGNIGMDSIIVIKRIDDPRITGYDLFLLMAVIPVISIILVKKRHRSLIKKSLRSY